MFILLHHILMTFMTLLTSLTFSSGEVIVESVGAAVRESALDGKVSSDSVLFQATVATKVACASSCVRTECCFTFTTSRKGPTSKLMTCRGYPRLPDARSTFSEPGSKTYSIKKTASASSWLERPCSANSDCPATNSECFVNVEKCLCTPGYYYSHCSDSCVRDCPQSDLRKTFLEYPLHFLENENFASESCKSAEEGQQNCLAISECRSFNMWKKQKQCFMKNVTALSPKVNFRQHDFDHHYQRTCL